MSIVYMSSTSSLLPVSRPSHNLPDETMQNIEEKEDVEAYRETYAKYRELLPNLPKGKGWATEHLVQYQGFWLNSSFVLKAVMLLQDHFKAGASNKSNIFLATFPKSGTTWLRALIFATINRTLHDVAFPHHRAPRLFSVLRFDAYLYNNNMHEHCDHDHHSRSLMSLDDGDHDGDGSTSIATTTRLFATHMPYSLLPKSVTTNNIGGSKFVCICRNPKDVFISSWNFMNKLKSKVFTPLSLEEAFELFCQGVSEYGPFWDHVLGFWKASLEFPEKILFLKYEDLKKEPDVHVKRLAEFLGQPFSLEEESQGVVQQIIKLCIENLSGLEVNKTSKTQLFSKTQFDINNCDFFRKGQVGDWKNFFTEDMAKRMDQITYDTLIGFWIDILYRLVLII